MNYNSRFSEENAMKRAPGIKKKPTFQSKLPPASLEDLANARKLKNFGKYSGKNLEYGRAPEDQKASESEDRDSEDIKNQWTVDSRFFEQVRGTKGFGSGAPESQNTSNAQKTSNLSQERAPEAQNLTDDAQNGQNSENLAPSEAPENKEEDSDSDEAWGIQSNLASRPVSKTKKTKGGPSARKTTEYSPAFVVHVDRNPKRNQGFSWGLAWTEYGSAVFRSQPHLDPTGETIHAGVWVSSRIEQYRGTNLIKKTCRLMGSTQCEVQKEGPDDRNPKLVVNLVIGENTHSDMESFFVRHSLCRWIRIKIEHAKGKGDSIIQVLIHRLQKPIKISDDDDKLCYWEVEKVLPDSDGQCLRDSESAMASEIQNQIQNLRIVDEPIQNLLNPQNPPRTLWNSGLSRYSGGPSAVISTRFPGTGRTCSSSSPSSSFAQNF